MKRKILVAIVLVIVVGLVYSVYMYNKPHRNINEEEASFSMSADELYVQFEGNVDEASAKYADKVVTLAGKVASINKNTNGEYFVIMKGSNLNINFAMDPTAKFTDEDFPVDQTVKIKGLFVGFDDLLYEVQFKKCSLVN